MSLLKKAKTIIVNNKVAIFPVILLLILLFMTSLQISGTSVGIYHEYFYGKDAKDPDLLFGKPQPIRSDEWLVNTQMILAQEQNNNQRINHTFNGDKDMSVFFDIPYVEWSALFKPQNFSFFVLPMENAFAFKWWFILFALMMAVYFFCLRLLPNKIWLAIAFSLTLAYSPYVFWWYLPGTIGCLAYGLFILLVGMSLLDRRKLTFFKKSLSTRASVVIKTLMLIYLLVSFALLLYPPFQIPIALAVFFFMLGYFLKRFVGKPKKTMLYALTPFAVAIISTGALCGAYIIDRAEIIETINNTAYPGKRVVTSGGYDAKKLLVPYLQPQLQREGRSSGYGINQSESSSFILLPIFFIIPSIALLMWLYVKQKKFEWVLSSIIVCNLLFLAYLFIPNIDPLTHLFLLHLVPHDRVMIGFGFLAIILLIYMIKVASDAKLIMSKKILGSIVIYSLIFYCLMIWTGFETIKLYPDFISSKKLVLLLASVLMIGFVLLLANRPRAGMTIIALFSLASVLYIHPLYRGLGVIYNNDVTKTIKDVSDSSSVWAAAQDIYIENFPQISGRAAITGVASYPNNSFWKANTDLKDDKIYNRYAHVFLSSNDSAPLVLVAPDLFAVSASCTRKVSQKIDYIISTAPLIGTCHQLLKTLPYPQVTFYFYQVRH